MEAAPKVQVFFTDRYRFWQEFLHASERNERVFVPTDRRDNPGTELHLEVHVAGENESIQVQAVVESRRPPSLRFSRGLFVTLSAVEQERLRLAFGLHSNKADATAGRGARRYPVQWPVRFRTPALPRVVTTEDLSAGGMLVDMPERVQQGHVLEFTLYMPQGHELRLAGTVMWTSETSRRVGLQFYFEDERTRRVFRGTLENGLLAEAVAAEEESGATHMPVVLVADSDENTLALARGTLESCGYRVVEARSGEEALALTRSTRPALAILDILTPSLDGTTVCRAVRSDVELAELPIIFLGMLDERSLEREARDSGASDYLHKPLDPLRLEIIVKSYVPLSAAEVPHP